MADDVFTFGKHVGKSFSWVLQNDSGYADWASGKSGALRAFSEYAKRTRLDQLAPLPAADVDVNTAALAVLRRSGFAQAASEAEREHNRDMKRHREDAADARFQANHKYRANGYSTPEAAHAGLPPLEAPGPLRMDAVLAAVDEDDVDQGGELLAYARAMVEVSRSANPDEYREFAGLDNDTRKRIHNMAESFPDLTAVTRDRRDARDPTRRRHHGATIATMTIRKKK